MSNIRQAFQNGKAFILFITCGDPGLKSTKQNVWAAVAAGADLMELGIPFSDPTVEGPVIQAINLHMFSGGVMTDAVFRMVAEPREELTMPLAFMTYANVISSYDITYFVVCVAEVGIDGIILLSMSFEEKEEFAPALQAVGTDFISMTAPTSMVCIREIVAMTKGSLCVASSLGVTGVRQEISTNLSSTFMSVRQANPPLPVAIGSSISTLTQAKRMVAAVDGMIVGSAIVCIVAEKGCKADEETARYVREMRAAANAFQ